MRYAFLLNFLLVSWIIPTYAFSDSFLSPSCGQLPGLWFGTYTYKNVDDCRRSGACTHMLTAETKYLATNHYQVDLSPPVDRQTSLDITCENGQITLPVTTTHTVKFACDEGKMCRVTYDDARLSTVASKIN